MKRLRRYLTLIACCLISPAAIAAPDLSILNPSGLPIPRFVSLKSDDVNVRVGPGKRYPIRWHYARAGLPVQIIEEFAHWRKIRDHEGSVGWVHKGITDGRRNAIIIDKAQTLYAKPDATSKPLMRAEPLVIGRLKECKPDWCRMEIQKQKAWIRKTDIWGVTREEVFAE